MQFPAISDAMFEIEATSGEERMRRVRHVEKQLAAAAYVVHAARNLLRPFDDW